MNRPERPKRIERVKLGNQGAVVETDPRKPFLARLQPEFSPEVAETIRKRPHLESWPELDTSGGCDLCGVPDVSPEDEGNRDGVCLCHTCRTVFAEAVSGCTDWERLAAHLRGWHPDYFGDPPKPPEHAEAFVNWYRNYLKTTAWRWRRLECVVAAEYHCEHCNRYVPRRLQAHHVTYERVGHERPDDLIALCRRCHRVEHEIDGEEDDDDELVSPMGRAGGLRTRHRAEAPSGAYDGERSPHRASGPIDAGSSAGDPVPHGGRRRLAGGLVLDALGRGGDVAPGEAGEVGSVAGVPAARAASDRDRGGRGGTGRDGYAATTAAGGAPKPEALKRQLKWLREIRERERHRAKCQHPHVQYREGRLICAQCRVWRYPGEPRWVSADEVPPNQRNVYAG